jgi:hypothetical protein
MGVLIEGKRALAEKEEVLRLKVRVQEKSFVRESLGQESLG